MRVLVACEHSGAVRDALIAVGHDAVSCDFEASVGYGHHYQGDVFDIAYDGWDMMIAHPPCTFLCSSGLHWNKRTQGREQKTVDALEFVSRLWNLPILRVCLENPVGCINTRLPDMPRPQYIQPYEFGDDASKKTGLWLRNLPPLRLTNRVPGRIITWKGKQVERWSNQCDSGQNRLGPSKDRWKKRSTTYPGIAQAMATQWGKILQGAKS